MNIDTILYIPEGQWFGASAIEEAPDKLACSSWLMALVSSHFERRTDRARLTAHRTQSFLFKWQATEREETMDAPTITTIDWSALTPEHRNELVASYIMHECTSRIPAQHGIPEISVLLDGNGYILSSCPRYTEDIHEAWRIAATFDDAIVTLASVPGAYHHARIKPLANDHKTYHGFRLSAPEALCIAALRARGLTIINSEMDIISVHKDLAID